MNILSIGNSFSQDATRYLHQIARADKESITTVNLYIGGCPLSRHYRNMMSGERAYTLEFNGYSTGFNMSLSEALLSRDWDYVTMQQVSSRSNVYETYQPYLSALSDFVRECAPKAKQIMHQTWAYEDGSKRLTEEMGYNTQSEMTADIKTAYEKAADDIAADFIIPCGEAMQKLVDIGFGKVHRDTFHASFGAGRYALGLAWYRRFTGNDVMTNNFYDFDEEVTSEQISVIKKAVMEII